MPLSAFFFFSSRRRHTRSLCDWSSDVCSSDLKSDSDVGWNSALHRLERWLCQAVNAVERQQHTDAESQMCRINISQQDRADRHAGRAAYDERRYLAPTQSVPDLPDAVGLYQQRIADDQGGGLHWRQDVQPYA